MKFVLGDNWIILSKQKNKNKNIWITLSKQSICKMMGIQLQVIQMLMYF